MIIEPGLGEPRIFMNISDFFPFKREFACCKEDAMALRQSVIAHVSTSFE